MQNWSPCPAGNYAGGAAAADSGSDSDDASSASSEDSAQLRTRAAAARLRDYGEPAAPAGPARRAAGGGGVLPSALAALSGVDGPPAFLDPEATRRSVVLHGAGHAPIASSSAAPEAPAAWHGPRGRVPPGQEFDISRLAPPGKARAVAAA